MPSHRLEDAVRKGHFREDLYHRLNVLPLVVPPLRQRPVEDLLDLIRHFLSELTGGRPPRVSGRALDLMMDYRWPGTSASCATTSSAPWSSPEARARSFPST